MASPQLLLQLCLIAGLKKGTLRKAPISALKMITCDSKLSHQWSSAKPNGNPWVNFGLRGLWWINQWENQKKLRLSLKSKRLAGSTALTANQARGTAISRQMLSLPTLTCLWFSEVGPKKNTFPTDSPKFTKFKCWIYQSQMLHMIFTYYTCQLSLG